MMELRVAPNDFPQLLILGTELEGNEIHAFGYVTTKEAVSAQTEFEWEGWQFKLLEDLPEAHVALIPIHREKPVRLEILKWPQTTKS